MNSYTIKDSLLQSLINEWAKTKEVVAPVKSENFTKFEKISDSKEIVWGAPQTVISPKKYFSPQNEILLEYKIQEQNAITQPVIDDQNRILFGVHPCDINGIFLMDGVFSEGTKDDWYLARRNSTIIIGVDCLVPCSKEAICNRMDGLNPRERFDAFITKLGGGLCLVEVKTEKAEKLFEGSLKPANFIDKLRLKMVRDRRNDLFNKQNEKLLPKYGDLSKLMKNNFASKEWEARGELCYSCGSCNMVCPTCYCFDIQDYAKINLQSGKRMRVWDGCMLTDFAKIASGENFREERAHRLRHRTNRKINYLFEKWGQSFCTGCGRCTKACLTKLPNPLEIANAIYTRKS